MTIGDIRRILTLKRNRAKNGAAEQIQFESNPRKASLWLMELSSSKWRVEFLELKKKKKNQIKNKIKSVSTDSLAVMVKVTRISYSDWGEMKVPQGSILESNWLSFRRRLLKHSYSYRRCKYLPWYDYQLEDDKVK